MTGLETLALIAGIGGTALSAVGSIKQGNDTQAAMNAEAKAQERQANEERAASQREAIERSKSARLLISRQQAVAAASGGGATDTTVVNLMSDAAAEGAYQSASALYEGEARGRGLEDQAGIARWRGRQARTAGYINAGTTLLNGFSSYASYASKLKKPTGGTAMPKVPYSGSPW